jgi:hypothetical protein
MPGVLAETYLYLLRRARERKARRSAKGQGS